MIAKLLGPFGRISEINWLIVTLTAAIGFIGVMMQFSVGDADWAGQPVAHGIRFGGLLVMAIILAIVHPRFWMVVSYPLWIAGVAGILATRVPGLGVEGGGAVLWLKLGPVTIQPGEIMKLAVILSLARYYSPLSLQFRQSFLALIPALILVLVPAGLVAAQPDLGTAVLICIGGFGVMFLAGLRMRYVVVGAVLGVGAAVLAYTYVFEDYQRTRVNVFLGIEEDTLGAGYNILQSKIAIGAAGLTGEGFNQGSQAQLDYLPEKHTDFIYTMIVEEFGFVGGVMLLLLYLALMGTMLAVTFQTKALFSKLAVGGVVSMLGSYVFINNAMVMGLVPVVGVPLPFVSYGGSAMATMMIGVAIVLACHAYRREAVEMYSPLV